MNGRSTVLIAAEAVTLAHVGRAIALARGLHECGTYRVVLACDPREARFTHDLPFPVVPLACVPPEAFRDALARGRPVYSYRTLHRYAADDTELLKRVRPDVVVGDFRLSLSATARHAKVPYINVTNAYWSPYARPRFALPEIAGMQRVPTRVGNAVFRMLRPLAFALHAMPLNRLRRSMGLRPLPLDVRYAYCDGDETLYADMPGMIPLADPPSHHRVIGPVLWSPAGAAPAWWNTLLAGPRVIYVTLGSSGPVRLLATAIDALVGLGRPLVVATAGRASVRPRANVHAAPFVPGDAIASHAALVVCNGGSPTTYQALANGVPVIGLPSNLDQFLNMHFVSRFGAGRFVRADRATVATIRRAAEIVLADPNPHERARVAAASRPEATPSVALAAAIARLVDTRTSAPDDVMHKPAI